MHPEVTMWRGRRCRGERLNSLEEKSSAGLSEIPQGAAHHPPHHYNYIRSLVVSEGDWTQPSTPSHQAA
jgi:hypothetical protein